MSTIDLKTALKVIAGEFPEDNITRIVKYKNAWGRESYGFTTKDQDPNKYLVETNYVRNPAIYWDADPNVVSLFNLKAKAAAITTGYERREAQEAQEAQEAARKS